mmetsp:Transcript_47964/g.108887  ORF Transcript_47964/g.108887 Transcript_47964/m.108887 type:complete len:364 (-) Transcript_47964:1299-2390(-)
MRPEGRAVPREEHPPLPRPLPLGASAGRRPVHGVQVFRPDPVRVRALGLQLERTRLLGTDPRGRRLRQGRSVLGGDQRGRHPRGYPGRLRVSRQVVQPGRESSAPLDGHRPQVALRTRIPLPVRLRRAAGDARVLVPLQRLSERHLVLHGHRHPVPRERRAHRPALRPLAHGHARGAHGGSRQGVDRPGRVRSHRRCRVLRRGVSADHESDGDLDGDQQRRALHPAHHALDHGRKVVRRLLQDRAPLPLTHRRQKLPLPPVLAARARPRRDDGGECGDRGGGLCVPQAQGGGGGQDAPREHPQRLPCHAQGKRVKRPGVERAGESQGSGCKSCCCRRCRDGDGFEFRGISGLGAAAAAADALE